jgi:hypothetical protein
MALTANAHGGKSTKQENKVKDSVPFEAHEFLPPYAAYAPMLERYGRDEPLKHVDPKALQELYDRRNEISGLFFQCVPWNELRGRLGIVED